MKLLRYLVCLSLVIFSIPASAEQKMSLGGWDVHYMVVNTTFLTPEVASTYGIIRSKYNALVNISVLDKETKEAQRLSVSGEATNLLGNTRDLSFKKVEDGDAIYYLSVLPFRDQETFRFNIEIRKGNDSETLRFKQQMYTD